MLCKEWKFFLHLVISIILFVLVIINIFIQSKQTNEIKIFQIQLIRIGIIMKIY